MILSGYLMFNSIIFCISIFGMLLNRKNLLPLLIYIELMLLAINSNFIAYSTLWNDIHAQIWVLFILSITTAEFVLMLIILLKIFKAAGTIEIENKSLNNLRIKGQN
ncbi:MAG: NADH-quinone oxidoreductase subunit NuoK, partial [Gammaproteobacteria bacterium]